MTNGWKIFEWQKPPSRFCVMICVLVFLTRLDPYGSHFNWITELPLMCTRWPLLRNIVLLPICLVLENQQYINASIMSAQQWLRLFWTNMWNSLQMIICNMSLMVLIILWDFLIVQEQWTVHCIHIPIIAPESAHGDYLSRKGWYSIIIKAICDNNYIITDMNVGWPGRVHDARVFRHERYMDEEGEEEHEERDDRDGDGEEAQPSAIILRNDLATYFAITE